MKRRCEHVEMQLVRHGRTFLADYSLAVDALERFNHRVSARGILVQSGDRHEEGLIVRNLNIAAPLAFARELSERPSVSWRRRSRSPSSKVAEVVILQIARYPSASVSQALAT